MSVTSVAMLFGMMLATTAMADSIPAPVIVCPSSYFAGYNVEVKILIDNPDGHFLLYEVDYGDGTYEKGSIWDGSEELVFTHVWNDPGEYEITAQIADVDMGELTESKHSITIVLGVPAPVIECQRRGVTGQKIEVMVIIDNTPGHFLTYDLEYGDGDFERGAVWGSGTLQLAFTHVWDNPGIYDVTAQVASITSGMISDITEHHIRIVSLTPNMSSATMR